MKTKNLKTLPKKEKTASEDMHKKASIFKNVTTLHGTNHFSRKKGKHLLFWCTLMIVNIVLTISFLMVIKDRYNNDQIVTKIYSDCTLDLVPFPAVSICNMNVVSLKQTKGIGALLRRHNRPQKEIESFFHTLPTLKNGYHLLKTNSNFTEIMNILKSHYFTVSTIMEEVHQKCENLLLYCEFNNKEKNCQIIFELTQTYEGFCCTFNYVAIDGDMGEDPFFEHDEDFEYYYDQSEGEPKQTSIIATLQSGRSSGLRVVFNVEPQDYANWAFTTMYAAKVLISDPNDYPEVSTSYKYVTVGESVDIKVSPMVYQCDPSVRSVDQKIRNCWFHDEVTLAHTDRYSFETCTTECKMNSYLKGCGCVPYKYPIDKSIPACEFKDLTCIRDMKVHWETRKKPCVPECYKECNDKGYKITSDTAPFLRDKYPEHATKNRNVSELAGLQVYYHKPTCNCYKMSLLMDFNYFIATYGGVFSLSFGASIITLFEIFYLLLTWIVKFIVNRLFTLKFVH